MWEHYGNSSTGSNFSSTGSHQAETPNGGMSLFTLSEQYGQAVNVGGNVTMFTGSITFTSSKQVYDLTTDATLESNVIEANGDRIEVQRVFNQNLLLYLNSMTHLLELMIILNYWIHLDSVMYHQQFLIY